MRVLDLFSGIGGFSLGLERAGMETVAFCEYEEYPRKVLAKHWADVPCYPDVRTLTREQLIEDGVLANTNSARGGNWSEVNAEPERRINANDVGPASGIHQTHGSSGTSTKTIDLICGGYPCQPFSHAGKRAGKADDRHLWPEMHRLIKTIRPRWVLAENVAGHISMGLDDVLLDLEAAGYTWWTFVIPACAKDARHRRDRVWIVAHTEQQRGQGGKVHDQDKPPSCNGRTADSFGATSAGRSAVADTSGQRCEGQRNRRKTGAPKRDDSWSPVAGTSNAPSANTNNTESARFRKHGRQVFQEPEATRLDGGSSPKWWPTESRMGSLADGFSTGLAGPGWLPEPGIGRVATGVPDRVNKLKALGNSVVPQVVEQIGRAIMETENT